MNLISIFQVQEQISEAAPFSLTALRIRTSRLANPSQSLHQISPLWILNQVGLNRIKDIQSRRSRQSVQPHGKGLRLDVYHYVVYNT